jgi:DNA-binding CsgD family transcriptional regulator
MSVEAISGAAGEDCHTLEAAGPALDLIVAELAPVAVSLLAVDRESGAVFRDARSPRLLGDARREVRNWHRQVGARSPLSSGAITGSDRPVVTFADLGEARGAWREDKVLLSTYRRIGAIDDTRMLIRDGGLLVALIAVWRPLQSRPWADSDRRRLEALQPMVEMACLARARPHLGGGSTGPPDAGLTPRQLEVARLLAGGASNLEVARALGISRNTAKTHARAVLTKLDAGSRRELMLAPRRAGTMR